MRDSQSRAAAKALTWRAVASSTTAVLAYIALSGDLSPISGAAVVAGVDVVVKLVMYYGHERLWQRFDFGRKG